MRNQQGLVRGSLIRTYLAGFRLGIAHELSYRTNFLIGQLRIAISYGVLLLALSRLTIPPTGYSQTELTTYILFAALLSSQFNAIGMNAIASEIADGDLTNYLLRPLNYFGYWTSRLAAQRFLLLIGSIGIIALLLLLPSVSLELPTHLSAYARAGILAIVAIVLAQTMDFLAGIMAFWTERAYGPRFLLAMILQILSGAYLPLDLLPAPIQRVLEATPFPSLVYAPVATLLGRYTELEWQQALIRSVAWTIGLLLFLALLWKRGLRSYEAYGR